MAEVFISYARQDKDFVRVLHGVHPYIKPERLCRGSV